MLPSCFCFYCPILLPLGNFLWDLKCIQLCKNPFFNVPCFEVYTLRVCIISSYLFVHSNHIIISFWFSHIGFREHIQRPPKWTLHLTEPKRNLALWQEFGAVWELWVMSSAPASAFINCWSPQNNWLGILVNTSSANVCGSACLQLSQENICPLLNLLKNLAFICMTGSLSHWGPLPQSKVYRSLVWVVLAGFVETLGESFYKICPLVILALYFYESKWGGMEPQDLCV